jgi:MFS family permease
MLIALYYAIQPYFSGTGTDLVSLNNAMVFVGLGISLATLQDPSRSQNKVFRYISEHPGHGKRMIALMAVITLFIMIFGLIGFFQEKNQTLNELYFGFFLLGVGLIGFIKGAVDVMDFTD